MAGDSLTQAEFQGGWGRWRLSDGGAQARGWLFPPKLRSQRKLDCKMS
jgi:hypothetical protein